MDNDQKNKGLRIEEVARILNAQVVCGVRNLSKEVGKAFASDLMSDVLTLETDNLLLITGLANVQAVRTAEMSDIACIVLVRNKKANQEMVELAEESGITILEYPGSMFRSSGILFNAGIKPVF
ncbi:MAG: DRTGG domain-containing protein [Bacteroidales bacterium]